MRGIQTNGVVSHFCKQICWSDIWYYEKVYPTSIWDLVTETGWEKKTAEKIVACSLGMRQKQYGNLE